MNKETENNNQLSNPNQIENKITSPNTIDYLAGKVKEYDIGIKVEKSYPSGYKESVAVWNKDNQVMTKVEIQDIPTLGKSETPQTISSNQENFSKEEAIELAKTTGTNSGSSDSGSEN